MLREKVVSMSGYPGGSQRERYEDGYGHNGGNTDSYYQDDQYYDNGYDARGGQGGPASGQAGDGYYDESWVSPLHWVTG